MEQVLYRKYRSRSLNDVVGQDHITKSLMHALETGKLAHAYLFTGPRGVGKTSVARILAYAVNDLPYDDDRIHLDIIEIDAASNRRIDEVRDLRDKVNLAPTSAKYKVYIIDEVHMLTREAFNALLKTLEEPPAHVMFILATTEAHKLPETIISRTQRYSFKPVSTDKVIGHLKSIARKEKISITDEALSLIAEHGEGSFRDSISLLDQLRHQDNEITLSNVQMSLGLAPDNALEKILDIIDSGKPQQLIGELTNIYQQGYQASSIAKQLGAKIRYKMLNDDTKLSRENALDLLKQLLDVPASLQPESLLEIVLLNTLPDTSKEASQKTNNSKTIIVNKESIKNRDEAPKPTKKVSDEVTERKSTKEINEFDPKQWAEILSAVKKKHNAVYSVLRMAKPNFEDSILELQFAFKFHARRVSESKNKQLIAETVKEIMGRPIEITSIENPDLINDSGTSVFVSEEIVGSETVETINNIFGSSEVLES